jgi:tetratricopeptide (TPR) repeat protein
MRLAAERSRFCSNCRRGRPHLAALLVVLVVLPACARRTSIQAPAQEVASTTQAEPAAPPIDPLSLIAQGCFACLERALAAARDQGNTQAAFEAAALLVVRTRELGIPGSEWRDQARALGTAAGLPIALLDALDVVPMDPRSRDGEDRASVPPRRLEAAELERRRAAVAAAPVSAAFQAYLDLALTCSSEAYGTMTDEEVARLVPDALRDLPVLRYRLGACSSAHGPTLRALRSADAEYVDADYALGRYVLQVREYPDLDEAMRLLRSAVGAFPRSPSIATTAGDLAQTLEAWDEALALYDTVLALVPRHPDALLGRTIVLSNLSRHHDAIETATLLVDDGAWFLGQAFYWRAWNQFQLQQYLPARQDADRARTLMVNAGVYLLSGMIDWRLRRLPSAEREFEEALRMDFGQCEAAAFLGGVRNEQGQAPAALAAFTQALQCNDLNITLRRTAIARIESADATPAYKAREIARHQRAIDQAERRRAEALNGVTLLQQYLASIPARSEPPRR